MRPQALHHALPRQEYGQDHGQRQQHVQRRARDVDPEIADRAGRTGSKAADQRERNGNAGGGRKEVLAGQADHLRQDTHRLLAAVALPVGVGDEADGGVEARIGAHAHHAFGIEREPALQALQAVDKHHAHRIEGDQRQRVGFPALCGAGSGTGGAQHRALDAAKPAQARHRARLDVGGADARQQFAQRPGQCQQHDQKQRQQRQELRHQFSGGHHMSSGLNRAIRR